MLTVKTHIAILVGMLTIQTAGMTNNIFNDFFVHWVLKRYKNIFERSHCSYIRYYFLNKNLLEAVRKDGYYMIRDVIFFQVSSVVSGRYGKNELIFLFSLSKNKRHSSSSLQIMTDLQADKSFNIFHTISYD